MWAAKPVGGDVSGSFILLSCRPLDASDSLRHSGANEDLQVSRDTGISLQTPQLLQKGRHWFLRRCV